MKVFWAKYIPKYIPVLLCSELRGRRGKMHWSFLFGMCIPDMLNLVQVVPGQAGAEVSKLKRFIAYRAEQRLCL